MFGHECQHTILCNENVLSREILTSVIILVHFDSDATDIFGLAGLFKFYGEIGDGKQFI